MHYRYSITLLIFLLHIHVARGQNADSFHLPNVQIDEIIITNNQLNVNDFIQLIKEDTTFYKAFKSMRMHSFNAENEIKVYHKKNSKLQASLKSETKQIYADRCRQMRVLEETVTGDFYKKNGEYRYFTADLFAQLFFTKGKICNENNIVRGNENFNNGSGIEKRKNQLKQLIFNPGSKVNGVPFVGNKAAIFEPEMAKKYQFIISEEEKNGVSCYKFQAIPFTQYKSDVVINYLVTWFRKSDFSIVSRDYNLSYRTVAFDFDVIMHVDLINYKHQLLPKYITYKGNWHVASQKREIVNFSIDIDY